jgi:protoheme IX farnesyltransferase
VYRQYYHLTKPGIIRGNLLTAIGGFFLAANGQPDWLTFGSLVVGMSLVIAAGCVFNNYLDRDIDARMTRTKHRATVVGSISARDILRFGFILMFSGFMILLVGTNVLTALLGLFGLVTYVGIYTPAKHRTSYATLLGTIPGAVPPVAGYTAMAGRLDLACALLFGILVCWQVPHFYAIAIRRIQDYKAARVPVWPITRGIAETKLQMTWFATAFIVLSSLLSFSRYTGLLFLIIFELYGAYWLSVILSGRQVYDNTAWARKVFLLSLPVLPLLSLLLGFNAWLP